MAPRRGREDEEDGGHLPWHERFSPRTLEDVAVHKKKKGEVLGWLQGVRRDLRVRRPTQPILLLTGPSGCGKSALVHALAQAERLELVEWAEPARVVGFRGKDDIGGGAEVAVPYTSVWTAFREFLLGSQQYGSLEMESSGARRDATGLASNRSSTHASMGTDNKWLVIDDPLTFLSHLNQPREVQDLFAVFAQHTRFPLVVMYDPANVSRAFAMVFNRTLLSNFGVKEVKLNALAPTFCTKVLRGIMARVRLPANSNVVAAVVEASGGDLRRAIQTMEFHSLADRFDDLALDEDSRRSQRQQKLTPKQPPPGGVVEEVPDSAEEEDEGEEEEEEEEAAAWTSSSHRHHRHRHRRNTQKQQQQQQQRTQQQKGTGTLDDFFFGGASGGQSSSSTATTRGTPGTHGMVVDLDAEDDDGGNGGNDEEDDDLDGDEEDETAGLRLAAPVLDDIEFSPEPAAKRARRIESKPAAHGGAESGKGKAKDRAAGLLGSKTADEPPRRGKKGTGNPKKSALLPAGEGALVDSAAQSDLSMFHVLGKIMHHKGGGTRDNYTIDPEDIVRRGGADVDPQPLLCFIQENFVPFYGQDSMDDVCDAARRLSDAQLMCDQWDPDHALVGYGASLAVRGILDTNRHRAPSSFARFYGPKLWKVAAQQRTNKDLLAVLGADVEWCSSFVPDGNASQRRLATETLPSIPRIYGPHWLPPALQPLVSFSARDEPPRGTSDPIPQHGTVFGNADGAFVQNPLTRRPPHGAGSAVSKKSAFLGGQDKDKDELEPIEDIDDDIEE